MDSLITSYYLPICFSSNKQRTKKSPPLHVSVTSTRSKPSSPRKSLIRSAAQHQNNLPGNFPPVDELPPTRCPIIHGSIPPCLAGGAYIRNGPNPQFLPQGPHHIYDGDGMLHSLLFSEDGTTATFCSRYVKTYRYCLERDAGTLMIPKFFSDFHGFAGVSSRIAMMIRVLKGQLDPTQGMGTANTSVAFIGGCLHALEESDLPYSVHVDPLTGEISTIGRCDFEGQLVTAMSAHPKKDPLSGEPFAFRYSPMCPYLTYFHFDPAGNKLADVPIFSVKRPSIIHDFAITKNFVLFNDFQLEINLMDTLLGNRFPVSFNGGKVPRLGVLPRYATDDSNIRWFDVPGFNMLHAINAWEEEYASSEKFLVLVAPNIIGIKHVLNNMELVHCCVEMVRINLTTGEVSRKPLSTGSLDFGVIHPGYVGRQNRYAYLAVGHGKHLLEVCGVAKVDFSLVGTRDCVVARRDFAPSCLGGEPFFVPKDGGEEEDDGYLLSYVHHEDTDESRFVVMDAHSPKLDIVAEVVLPQRVPYGFHGLFVSRSQLLSQKRPRS